MNMYIINYSKHAIKPIISASLFELLRIIFLQVLLVVPFAFFVVDSKHISVTWCVYYKSVDLDQNCP